MIFKAPFFLPGQNGVRLSQENLSPVPQDSSTDSLKIEQVTQHRQKEEFDEEEVNVE